MLAGGLLQVFDVWQKVLENLASWIMFAITAWVITEYMLFLKIKIPNNDTFVEHVKPMALWLGIVFCVSIVIEQLGVSTGFIFGRYNYSPVLRPFIAYVPLAIGFAWINMLLPSTVLVYLTPIKNIEYKSWLIPFAIAVLMVIFDFILEKAAIKLNYWYWLEGKVPMQNYLAWFFLGFIFAKIGFKLNIAGMGFPKIIQHAYFAQLGYFILVLIS